MNIDKTTGGVTMLMVPKGTRMVLVRHAESLWNLMRERARLTNQSPPIRTPENRDPNLSPMGRLEAYFAGQFLKHVFNQTNGSRSLDLIAYSTSNRAVETAHLIQRSWGVVAKRMLPPQLWLGEIQHADSWAVGEEYMKTARDVADYMLEQIAEQTFKLSDEERHRAIVTAVLNEMGSRGLPRLVQFAERQYLRDPLTRKKLPSGESYLAKRQRLLKYLPNLQIYLNGLGENSIVVVISHGATIIALRQIFEGFSDSIARIYRTSDGPPFPPHVGMTFYTEKNGILVKDSSPNRLPPQLVPHGRLLDWSSEVTAEEIQQACDATGVRFRNPKTKQNVPLRTKSGNMPALTVATKPFAALVSVIPDDAEGTKEAP